MVAELLRLRLRILANGFRRPPLQRVAIVVGMLVAIAGVFAFYAGAEWVSQFDDRFVQAPVRDVDGWHHRTSTPVRVRKRARARSSSTRWAMILTW